MSSTNPQWGQQNPQGQQGWGQPPQPPKKSGAGKKVGIGCLAAVGIVVVIGVIAAVAGGGDSDDRDSKASTKPSASASKSQAPLTSSGNKEHKPEDDVRMSNCAVDSTLGYPSVDLTITNHTSKVSDYSIQVEFTDKAGTRLADGYGGELNVRPGQSVKSQAGGSNQVTGQVTCKVVSIDRHASFTG